MKKVFLGIIAVMFGIQPLFTLTHTQFLDARSNLLVFVVFFLSFPLLVVAIAAFHWPRKWWTRGPMLAVTIMCSLLALIPLGCEAFYVRDIFTEKNDPSYEKLHELH